eukprot:c22565_g3_i1 orf=1-174(-)
MIQQCTINEERCAWQVVCSLPPSAFRPSGLSPLRACESRFVKLQICVRVCVCVLSLSL